MPEQDSYHQIPIPDQLSQVYHQAEVRWQKQRKRRVTRLAVCAACAAFLIGLSIPVLTHLRPHTSQPGSTVPPDSSASSQAPITGDPVSGSQTQISLLPTYDAGIIPVPSETAENSAVRQTIIDFFAIPEDFWAETRYYYNEIDLDADGTDEIFVVVMGMYTSGTGGDSALLLSQANGQLAVLQSFTLVHMPVLVSDHTTNGWRDLILPVTGGGAESSYAVLCHGEEGYPGVSQGTSLSSLSNVTGTAILYTDVTAPDAPRLTLAPSAAS